MATKLKSDALYTLAVDVRFNGDLYQAGLQFLGSDELVKSRPELFAEFALGHREVLAVREALEQAEFAELARQAQARAAAAQEEEKPAGPAMVVCVKSFTDAGVVVSPGELWRADHPTVLSAASAFAAVED